MQFMKTYQMPPTNEPRMLQQGRGWQTSCIGPESRGFRLYGPDGRTEALVLLYDKSSLREYINRKARLGSHGILFTCQL